MVMRPEILAVVALLLGLLAEWLHWRRSRRLGRLAFGPEANPGFIARAAILLRPLGLALLLGGLAVFTADSSSHAKPHAAAQRDYRHLLIALDVSPSMQLKDSGPAREWTRAQRASQLLLSLLERTPLEDLRVSIVAFYSGAKPVVIDTSDLNVVKNVLNDLPLDYAFEIGKTRLFEGLEEASRVAAAWKARSAMLVVVSDGDTVPDEGMPKLPPSIGEVVIVGVGDPVRGEFIDGHHSRQEAFTLRQVAARLGGKYHNGHERHIPRERLSFLSSAQPPASATSSNRRLRWALAAVLLGAIIVSGLPVALAVRDRQWQSARRPQSSGSAGNPHPRNEAFL